ncbi:unnamed protein product [Darwinula stevensoni]|uniref:Uncharacterized protein n=1 Tax=Darwinula stevensoni TaxID=69355 RepID=A0A7R9FSB6_9CRUS|nr:unnamed protein product [Darwinula stevensoni]CAG0903428.1 unnamed protein product [Darwinula stevensoni]
MFYNTFGPYKNCECGLVTLGTGESCRPIPLTRVSVDVTWLDLGVLVTIAQTFRNDETKSLEIQYVFPIDDRASICAFEAEIEGRKVKGEARDTEEAREIYRRSVERGWSASLTEDTKPDVLLARLGSLPPGSVASIALSYVTEATVERDALRFSLPTTVAPMCIPPSDSSEAAGVVGTTEYSLFSPCPLEVWVRIDTMSQILSLNSPTHQITVTAKNEYVSRSKHFETKVRLAGRSTHMRRDFVLLLQTAHRHEPRLILERSPAGTFAATISFVPRFLLPPFKCEFLFVIDRSCSMAGDKMEKAKDALKLFLESLPTDSYFNVIGFGFRSTSLWDRSKECDERNLKKAIALVEEMQADHGDTDAYEPLSTVFHQPFLRDRSRQIVVLTDGEASDGAEKVVSLVSKNCKNEHETRVFALGLGNDASRRLVNGIAKAGKGQALFASQKESLRDQVQELLKNAMRPALSSVEITWASPDDSASSAPPRQVEEGDDREGKESWIGAKDLPCVFDGTSFSAYCIYDAPSAIPGSITASADSPAGPLSIAFPVVREEALAGTLVHTLAARSILGEIEGESRVHGRAVELGTKYNLASRVTSFVAVDDDGEIQAKKPIFVTGSNTIPFGCHSLGESGMTLASFDRDTGRCKNHSIRGFGKKYLLEVLACFICFPIFLPIYLCRWLWRKMTRRHEVSSPNRDACEDPAAEPTERSPFLRSRPEIPVIITFDEETDEDRLKALASLQRFDGSFPLNQELLTLLRLHEEEVWKEREETQLGDSELATALAVSFMQTRLSPLENRWELVAKKSLLWLEEMESSSLIERSKRLLQTSMGGGPSKDTKPDVLLDRLGSLPPGSVASIALSYVIEATVEGDALRFSLPTTVAPRCIPPSDSSEAAWCA